MKQHEVKYKKAVIDNVDCPKGTCQAKKGEVCRTISGRKLGLQQAHIERMQAYDAQSKAEAIDEVFEAAKQHPDVVKDEGMVVVNGVGGPIELFSADEPELRSSLVYNDVATHIMGASPEVMRERNRKIEDVENGIKLSMQIMGTDAAVKRLATAIVDGEGWLDDYRR